MRDVLFDIDGTLLESFEFDEQCFIDAVFEVTECAIDTDWDSYKHVTDTGLLIEAIERANIDVSIEDLEPRVKDIFIQKVASHILRGMEPGQ